MKQAAEGTARVYVSIGSNIEPEKNILAALRSLKEVLFVTGISSFYRTAAIGRAEQPPYLNGVAAGVSGPGGMWRDATEPT